MVPVEILDVLTPDGAPSGRTKRKDHVHRDGDWHRSAHLWIATPDGRLLLQRRSPSKENWPNLWDISVAGHIDAGESPIEAAIREAHEELGLTLRAEELRHLGTLRYHAVLNGGAYIENEFHEVFLTTREIDLGALVLDPREVAEVALVLPEEIERYEVVPHEAEYALLHRALRA